MFDVRRSRLIVRLEDSLFQQAEFHTTWQGQIFHGLIRRRDPDM
jgi:hypothetical protein